MNRPPQLPHEDYPWTWIHRNLGREPRWTFPDLIYGNNLRCERLDFENYHDLWPLLAGGDTTFVNKEYREEAGLYQMVLHQYAYGAFSSKHGMVDYLIVDTPNENEEYHTGHSYGMGALYVGEGERFVGVLHLYHLSLERYDNKMPNPFVGIQLGPGARGEGIGGRAIGLLEQFVFSSYPETEGVTAMIKPNNERSLRLFRGLGYENTDAYDAKNEVFLTKDKTKQAS